MRKFPHCLAASAAMLTVLLVGGCGPQEKEKEEEHGHHHHGSSTPHGGHLIKLEPADYVAEWTHDDKAGKITIYILDSEGKKDAPIAVDRVKIRGEIKGTTPIPFEYPLIAVDPSEEDPPKAFKFENSRPDPKLITNVKMGDAVGATLEFEVGGKSYRGVITHDHDH
jgi:hypothetical protein